MAPEHRMRLDSLKAFATEAVSESPTEKSLRRSFRVSRLVSLAHMRARQEVGVYSNILTRRVQIAASVVERDALEARMTASSPTPPPTATPPEEVPPPPPAPAPPEEVPPPPPAP